MPRDIDPENFGPDDLEYVSQRHGMQKELEFQTGITFEEVRQAVEEDGVINLQDLVDAKNDPDPEPSEEPVDNEDPVKEPPTDPDAEEDEDDDENMSEPEDYKEWTHAELKDEIDSRNESRDEDDHISKGGSADDLRARLIEDDEVAESEDDQE